MYPEDLKYTAEHEWARNDNGTVTVGITSFAQEALGDIVYVQLPAAGVEIRAGDAIGEVESTKSVSDVYAPISGVVVERNPALDARPELINEDPYGEGWLFSVTPHAAGDLDGLLDAAAYAAQLGS